MGQANGKVIPTEDQLKSEADELNEEAPLDSLNCRLVFTPTPSGNIRVKRVQTLPEGWTCVQDHETGVPYYVSPNKAQWQPPCKLLYPPIKDESIFVAQPDSALLEKEISTDLFQEIYNEIKGSTTLRKIGEQQRVKESEQPQEPPLPDPFDETAICQICCENTPQLMLPCSHVFCRKCIEEWFKKKNICPVCCREQNQNPWLIVDEPSNEEVMDFVVKRIFPPVMKM